MKLVDDVIQRKHGRYGEGAVKENKKIDAVRNYEELRKQVSCNRLP